MCLDSSLLNFSCSGSVGISGTMSSLFYAQITESMKKSEGGGNPEEGELIELVEIPVKDSLAFALDDSRERPAGLVCGILWYHACRGKH